MSLGTDIISRTVKTQKLFNFQVGKCFYTNIQASRINQKIDEEPVIKIVNTVCKQVGSKLIKITQIRFKEKLIVIEDEYVLRSNIDNLQNNGEKNSSHPTKSSDGSNNSNAMDQAPHRVALANHKKKLIFKKKYLEDNSRIEKRNTKNVSKNFCKAFANFLQQSNKREALTKTKQLMTYYNYNNKTIQAICRDPQLKQIFKNFLDTKAYDWVQSSKVHDKNIHKQAIKIYISLIENKQEQQQNSKFNGQMIEQNNSRYKNHNGNGIMDQNNRKQKVRMGEKNNNSVYQSDELYEQASNSNNENFKSGGN